MPNDQPERLEALAQRWLYRADALAKRHCGIRPTMRGDDTIRFDLGAEGAAAAAYLRAANELLGELGFTLGAVAPSSAAPIPAGPT